MSQKNHIRVAYTVKNDSGFIVDRIEKFSSVREAMEFVQMFKHLMLCKPTMKWNNFPK
jgi:hypothetical protein